MPSSSPKQARFMAAVAHGWKPTQKGGKAPPLKVAKEFNKADKGTKNLEKGMKGRKRYQFGGLSQMAQMMGQQQQPQGQALSQRGGAGRWSPQQQQAWRGRQRQQRGVPAAGGFLGNVQRQAEQQRAAGPQTGMLADLKQQALQQRQALPIQPAVMPGGGQTVGGQIDSGFTMPPFNRTPSGEIDLGGGRTPEWGPGGPMRQPPQGPLAPGGGPFQGGALQNAMNQFKQQQQGAVSGPQPGRGGMQDLFRGRQQAQQQAGLLGRAGGLQQQAAQRLGQMQQGMGGGRTRFQRQPPGRGGTQRRRGMRGYKRGGPTSPKG